MTAYLKRLATTLAAYQIADVVSKFIAVLLLPVYTRYIDPAGYGTVELLANGVIFISILVRFGMIEAFLRFYFTDSDQERRDALARRAVAFTLLATTLLAIILAAAAAPLSRVVLGHTDVGDLPDRGARALGVHQSRARLRPAAGRGASAHVRDRLADQRRDHDRGLCRARGRARQGPQRAAARQLRRLDDRAVGPVVDDARAPAPAPRRPHAGAPSASRRCCASGCRPCPPRPRCTRSASSTATTSTTRQSQSLAGLYSIAIKLAGAVAFIVRAFQYAWPPLAYSITDDREAARFYGLVTTYYVAVSGFVVAGLALLGRWVVRLLAAPSFYDAYKALPWVALGWALYGLWVVFLVIAARAKVTTRNFPAAIAGLAANVLLLVTLVPPLGIAGAGIALCGAYVVMLTVMHFLTRRLFAVAFEWRRLAASDRGDGRDRGTGGSAAADPRCARLGQPGRGARPDRAGAAPDSVRAPSGGR